MAGLPKGAHTAFPFRDVVSTNQLRAVGLPRESLNKVSQVVVEVLCVCLGADPIDAVRGVFVDVAPAWAQQLLIDQLVEAVSYTHLTLPTNREV